MLSIIVLKKTLESPLDCKEIHPVHCKGDQSWVFIGTPGLMLKLKLQYFGHLVKRADSLKKTLMLGKNEGRRRRGQQRMRWLDGLPTQWTWVWANWEIMKDRSLACYSPWGCIQSDMTDWLNNNNMWLNQLTYFFTRLFSNTWYLESFQLK